MARKRSIFEEVTEDSAPVKKAQGGMIDGPAGTTHHGVIIWLAILFALVALMIIVGGLTRLTDSGLSITEWKPVTGIFPPMTAEVWAVEFTKYQATPEYQLQNFDMTLAEFKGIYWWEWGHRQLGRVTGLIWVIGLSFLFMTKRIPNGWLARLITIGLLGGLQGLIGWWMVSSGLTGDMTDVASYRLATHLGLAFLILGLITWFILCLGRTEMDLFKARRQKDHRLAVMTNILLALLALQILQGALVAGIDAGRGYTDWPLMNGSFLPSESFDEQPLWRNFLENPALVQFNHRIAGYLLFMVGTLTWWQSRRSALTATRLAFNVIAALLLVQLSLGIMTVLYAAPWHLAILHQLMAIALLVAMITGKFHATYPPAQSLR